jgi:hypothetical protein
MATATLTSTTPFAAARPTKRGFWHRLYLAVLKARMRAAMREIAQHRHLLPEDQARKLGYKPTLGSDSALPFVR